MQNIERINKIIQEFKKKPDLYKASSLISNFGKENKLNSSFEIYKILINSSIKPDIFVFKAIMNACMKCNEPKRLLSIWNDMTHYSIPLDSFCFGNLIRSCAKTGDVFTAKKLFEKLKNGEFESEVTVLRCTQLIQSFSIGKHIGDAFEVFQFMI